VIITRSMFGHLFEGHRRNDPKDQLRGCAQLYEQVRISTDSRERDELGYREGFMMGVFFAGLGRDWTWDEGEQIRQEGKMDAHKEVRRQP